MAIEIICARVLNETSGLISTWRKTRGHEKWPADNSPSLTPYCRSIPGRIMASRIHRGRRARRAGIVVNKARSTVFTVSALWKTCATSGSSKTATDPARTRSAKRFGFALL